MNILKEKISQPKDIQDQIYLFTLFNDSGFRVKISNYGGIISEIYAPDKNGNFENICLGFDRFEEYFSEAYSKANPYFGAIIGRYANRVANGSFTIDGITFKLPKNNAGNTLHGGIEGFDKKIWDHELLSDRDSATLVLKYRSPDKEEGFPGNLDVQVHYKLNEDNELSINYIAFTDKKTHLNLTNHTYFNLNGGKSDVLGHEIIIHSDSYLENNENNIPTGKNKKVNATPFDFRKNCRIGERIEQVKGKGYDHNFILNDYNGNIRKVAQAIEPVSGRMLKVFTTEPGMQFYTGNFLDGTLLNKDTCFTRWSGFCFETQHYPDTPNQPDFPTTLLNPGVMFDSTTIYKFGVIKP